MGKTEDHTDRCKDILCPWTGRVNTIKNDHTTQGNLYNQCNRLSKYQWHFSQNTGPPERDPIEQQNERG